MVAFYQTKVFPNDNATFHFDDYTRNGSGDRTFHFEDEIRKEAEQNAKSNFLLFSQQKNGPSGVNRAEVVSAERKTEKSENENRTCHLDL